LLKFIINEKILGKYLKSIEKNKIIGKIINIFKLKFERFN